MSYTNSQLVDYISISPNKNSPRNHAIDRITPHCYVGQASVESMASWLCNAQAEASANYGIGNDGRVVLLVEEKDRSWCSSSSSNDNRAVTIECASDSYDPYAINTAVYNKLIKLMVDICQRNGKKKLLWLGDKNKTLSYEPKADEMIITVHRWFANKACPGDYIYNRLGKIASEVTNTLKNKKVTQTAEPKWYRVRTEWTDTTSQVGAYENLEKAKQDCPPGYSVFDYTGKCVYTNPHVIKYQGLPKSKQDFIDKVADIAKSLYPKTTILPSVVIAQCCLETGYGLGADAKELVEHNNLLGMKAELLNSTWSYYSVWNGKTISKLTPEVYNGKTKYITDVFRDYTDYENCITDYEMFLLHVMSGGQYKYRKVISTNNPKEVITIISKGGYATDPSYITKVLKIIEENELTKYDIQVGAIKTEVPLINTEAFDGFYRVQIGAFTKRVNARRFAKEAKANGLTVIVKKVNDVYRVQAGAYKELKNAKKKLKEVKALGYTNAFLTP